MISYRVETVPEAEDKLREYLAYILLVFRDENTYEAVKKDYRRTLERLADNAGGIVNRDEPELRKRGLKRINFEKHNYFLLYEIIDAETPIARVVDMFHSSEDYINKLR